MALSPQALLDHLSSRTDDFEPIGPPVPLTGGLLNHVWRIPAKPHSIIAKFAPDHIATLPHVPMDQSRIHFEAEAICLLSRSEWSHIFQQVRPPQCYDYDPVRHILLMEDIGTVPDLGSWLQSNQTEQLLSHAQSLASFFAHLHLRSREQAQLAMQFDNQAVQQTREQVQYNLTEYLLSAEVPHAAEIGQKVKRLGKLIQSKGVCLIMGDLWPPSVLVSKEGLRIIDWEFAHFGFPFQDIAHLFAHLYMQEVLQEAISRKQTFQIFRTRFHQHYLDQVGTQFHSRQPEAWFPVHVGGEILMRILGPFRSGYFFDKMDPAHPLVQQLIQQASRAILDEELETFA
ncbi:MAG: phosphotransferase [Bacteroidota bacterium]